MKFIISGQPIEIHNLEEKLNKAFISLHAAYLGNQACDWEEFENAAIAYFDSIPHPSNQDDYYFNNFTVIWKYLMNSRRYEEADTLWAMAFSPVRKWEAKKAGNRLHKGSGYYYWSVNSLSNNDIDKGYVLMHQAVEEDIRTSGKLKPNTPAYALVNLNYGEANQAFLGWVIRQAKFLDGLQNQYSAQYNRKFILDDFKKKFLLNPPSVAIVFLFVYTVARIMRILEFPPHAVSSQFAGQLEINLLFDIVLVIDAVIKAKNQKHRKFIQHANFLSSAMGDEISLQKLGEINDAKDRDFDGTLKVLINGNYKFADGSLLSRKQSDIALAYCVRNKGAHDVESSPVVWSRFVEIQQILMNVLFASLDHLYT